MATIKKILNLQEKVERLLTKYPELRDDDKLLVSKMWDIELRKQNLDPSKTSINMFLSLYENNCLSNAELIGRARRKIQENNIELRGEFWYERHKEAELTRTNITKF
jgi:hypothetical protein